MRYEGFGPAGTSIIVEALTDNRNRTASNVRSSFQKFGGSLGETGSVSHAFKLYGFLKFNKDITTEDEFFNFSIENGAEDCFVEEDEYEAVCLPDTMSKFYDLLAAKYGEPVSSGFQWRPDVLVKVDGDKLKSLINLINELDSDEDVQQIFSNFEASDEELSRIA